NQVDVNGANVELKSKSEWGLQPTAKADARRLNRIALPEVAQLGEAANAREPAFDGKVPVDFFAISIPDSTKKEIDSKDRDYDAAVRSKDLTEIYSSENEQAKSTSGATRGAELAGKQKLVTPATVVLGDGSTRKFGRGRMAGFGAGGQLGAGGAGG